MDEKKNDGGSAFPRYGNDPWGKPSTQAAGMTLRDYFAAKAMQAYIAADINQDDSDVALNAYALADAMLAERAE
jgi:hypothetical protein